MSIEIFIAKRILPNRSQGIKVSQPILRIAVISISLSIVVNLLTLAIVTGFQNEIRRKITGFSAPLFIQNQNNADFYESDPIHTSPFIESKLQKIEGISDFDRVAYKPGMLQSARSDDPNTPQDVFGLIFKGVDKSYHWEFLREHLVQGKIPRFNEEEPSEEILISQKVANLLNLKVNQEVQAFFVKNEPIARKFKIAGIYNTGFEDYDSKLVLCDIRTNQKLNDWGISGQLTLADTLYQSQLLVRLDLQGNEENLLFDWGHGTSPYRGQLLPLTIGDTTLKVKIFGINTQNQTLNLRAKSEVKITRLKQIPFAGLEITKEALNASGSSYKMTYPVGTEFSQTIKVETRADAGTSNQYISGYEVHLNDWYQLKQTQGQLSGEVEMVPTEHGELVRVVSIFDLEQDLFNWLGFLDINVAIIIILMLIIGIINMGSALLVLIVIRTQFIGLMKAMGAKNKTIRRIFLMQASYLIGRGMLIGNVIGISLYALQKYTHVLTLNPEVYYLDSVPVELNLLHFLLLNAGTFLVCMTALLLPSMVITGIRPVRAIKFN
ncbi:MAG: ABC transporter permease [Flavobacteriia bacterium]|nr:ABC transporter permease [Flavobacteriia bacterium]NBV68217.1 ABC transporter permease [Flavobacteriia bacterium]